MRTLPEGWPASLNYDEAFEIMDNAIVTRYGTYYAGVAAGALSVIAPFINQAVDKAVEEALEEAEDVIGQMATAIRLLRGDTLGERLADGALAVNDARQQRKRESNP